jgi:hypothetical protein
MKPDEKILLARAVKAIEKIAEELEKIESIIKINELSKDKSYRFKPIPTFGE